MELWCEATVNLSCANVFKKRLSWCAALLVVTTHVKLVSCIATLTLVPTSANCGDQVELTCTSTECKVAYTFTKDGSTIYNHNGPANSSYVDKYSGYLLSNTETRLTISNVQYSDVGSYSCDCRFDKPAPKQTLQYECKANTTVSAITSDKKLNITVDRLYPQPTNIRTVLGGHTNLLQGTCVSSSTLAFHFMCTWVSTASLPDGNHSYTITVTTGTQTAQVSGRFRIVTSTVPSISNLANISNNDEQANGVLHGVQDTPLTIHCVSKEGIPAPTLAWYRGNTSTFQLARSKTTDNVQQSDGTYTVTLTHNFTPSRRDDMIPFLCRVFYPGATTGASNDPSPASAILYLDLQPDNPTVSQTDETVSGGTMNLRCTSTNGRPAPSITWSYRGQTFNPTSSSSFVSTSKTYTVESVLQRPVTAEDNGQTATCRVSNTALSTPRNGSVIVDIKYPPAVTVSTTVYTVTCKAEGYPDSYTYQDWVQIWPGYGPVATIPFNGTTLNLAGATYERSGVYVCGASNGVAVYGTNVKFIKGNTTVLIKAPPVLTDPSHDGTRVTVVGRLGHDATFEIKYWSNVNDSVVKCYTHLEESRSSSSVCSVTETDTEVTLPVHNHMVTETGTLATIKIHISSQENMTAYDVIVSNNVQGESVLGITIVPQGPPEAPTLLGNFSITPGQVILTVEPGFHGGYNQTLVVQISIDLTTWINTTSVYIGLDIRNTKVILGSLRENTLHHVRVFAYNTVGRSDNFSTVMNFITAKDLPAKSPLALIGGAVGTIFALFVVAVVLVVVWRHRKVGWMLSKKTDRRSIAKDQDNADSVVECTAYVSAENVQPATSRSAVYSKTLERGRSDPSANVYAVVSKTKKGLPEIPQVAETFFYSTNNQTSKPPMQSMKNVNDDDLIYADLEFDSTATYDVIHGLDDATIYVEIDFTKTAEPLPDSDEESNKKI